MKKKRYSEEQIVRILRETDRDTVPEVTKRQEYQRHRFMFGENALVQ